MLTKRQQKLYDAFYESTHHNECLDQRTEVLIGLSAAMAMNCEPCVHYYLKQAKMADITRTEISEVLAKVMAVAAGQKRLQFNQVLQQYSVDISLYD